MMYVTDHAPRVTCNLPQGQYSQKHAKAGQYLSANVGEDKESRNMHDPQTHQLAVLFKTLRGGWIVWCAGITFGVRSQSIYNV